MIGRAGIGVDNVDVGAATARGIVVMNTPGGNNVTTAEHAIALLLALARHIPQATASMKAGKWEQERASSAPSSATGRSASSGSATSARIVAERARGLGMKVIAYDPFVTPEAAAQARRRAASTLDALLARADSITVHVPLTPETRGLLGRDAFAKMKQGVLIVNAARGGIVDEAALLEALDAGKVAGAALDVFEEEPPPADHPLRGAPARDLHAAPRRLDRAGAGERRDRDRRAGARLPARAA